MTGLAPFRAATVVPGEVHKFSSYHGTRLNLAGSTRVKEGGIVMQVIGAVLGSLGTGLKRVHRVEDGLSTAELLGNAALAIGALVVIWGVLQAAGVEIVGWIRDQVIN